MTVPSSRPCQPSPGNPSAASGTPSASARRSHAKGAAHAAGAPPQLCPVEDGRRARLDPAGHLAAVVRAPGELSGAEVGLEVGVEGLRGAAGRRAQRHLAVERVARVHGGGQPRHHRLEEVAQAAARRQLALADTHRLGAEVDGGGRLVLRRAAAAVDAGDLQHERVVREVRGRVAEVEVEEAQPLHRRARLGVGVAVRRGVDEHAIDPSEAADRDGPEVAEIREVHRTLPADGEAARGVEVEVGADRHLPATGADLARADVHALPIHAHLALDARPPEIEEGGLSGAPPLPGVAEDAEVVHVHSDVAGEL